WARRGAAAARPAWALRPDASALKLRARPPEKRRSLASSSRPEIARLFDPSPPIHHIRLFAPSQARPSFREPGRRLVATNSNLRDPRALGWVLYLLALLLIVGALSQWTVIGWPMHPRAV